MYNNNKLMKCSSSNKEIIDDYKILMDECVQKQRKKSIKPISPEILTIFGPEFVMNQN